MSRRDSSVHVGAIKTRSTRQYLPTQASRPIPSSDPDAKTSELEMRINNQEQSLIRPVQWQSAEACVYRGARKTPTSTGGRRGMPLTRLPSRSGAPKHK